jgi:hypothetical protein
MLGKIRRFSFHHQRHGAARACRPRLEFLEGRQLLAVITVTSTADSVNAGNQVTLRAAIESIDDGADVNSAVAAHRVGPYLGGKSSPDEIEFDIPGSGVQTIDLTSALPSMTKPIIIDGYTQPGASANTNPDGKGLNGVLLIDIDAASAGLLSSGVLDLAGGDSTVSGLVINQAQGPEIELDGSGGDLIEGDFLGTNASGTQKFPPNSSSGGTLDGILLKSSANNTIGGTAPADRNLISGNGYGGIEIPLYLDTGNLIEGNLIGTDITGTKALGNGISGIDMYGGSGSNTTVGGTAAGAANVISGNPVGVEVAGPYLIQGNLIGTDPSGTLNVGNSLAGVVVSTNGSGAQIVGNTIAFNGTESGGGAGVEINSGDTFGNGNLVSQNSIFSNFGIGIELGAAGATANQPMPTPGPNNSQNYPIISSVTGENGGTVIQGTLTSVPNHTFTLEFFANAARDAMTFSDTFTPNPGEFGEGQTYIGSYQMTLGANGTASFTVNLPALPAHEPFVTATATDITGTGSGPANNTSEFSPVVPLGGPSFVVTNTGDTGLGTLREAIYNADNTPGSHTITFDVPATDPRHFYDTNAAPAGQVSQSDIATTTAASDSAITNFDPAWPHSWYSIEPLTPLPPLYDINSINGYSQPGSVQNTLVPDQQGLNTVLTIEIDGQNVTGDGLTLEALPSNTTGAAGTSVIQGLAINRFSGNGIIITSFGGDTIAGDFIGSDVSGTIALGNGENGIYIYDVNNATIGGNTNGAANLISGNDGDGIYDFDAGTSGLIENNVIGGGRSLTVGLANAQDAVDVETAPDSGTLADWSASQLMGATTSALSRGARAAAEFAPAGIGPQLSPGGLRVKLTDNATIFVGKGVPGGVKVVMRGSITGRQLGVSLAAGIILSAPTGGSGAAQITTQSISTSAATPTPPIELEGGANPLTSEPVLTTATTTDHTTVAGRLSSQPTGSYLIQFYSASQVSLTSGPAEKYQYIGSTQVTTNAAGNGAFVFTSPTAVPVGESIAATATLLDSSGNLVETSEFAQSIEVEKTQLQVAKVTATNLLKGRKNEGVSTISIVFNESMAPLADSSSFYSLVAPKKVRAHKKTRTEMAPVPFTARFTSSNTVTLKLVKPSKSPLTLTVKRGDPAKSGQTLGASVTLRLG